MPETDSTTERVTDALADRVAAAFSSFGGGRGSEFNPLAEALKDRPPVFAAGVSVRDVVEFVLELSAQRQLLAACRDFVAALDDTKFDVFIGSPAELFRLTEARSAVLAAIKKAEGR